MKNLCPIFIGTHTGAPLTSHNSAPRPRASWCLPGRRATARASHYRAPFWLRAPAAPERPQEALSARPKSGFAPVSGAGGLFFQRRLWRAPPKLAPNEVMKFSFVRHSHQGHGKSARARARGIGRQSDRATGRQRDITSDVDETKRKLLLLLLLLLAGSLTRRHSLAGRAHPTGPSRRFRPLVRLGRQ